MYKLYKYITIFLLLIYHAVIFSCASADKSIVNPAPFSKGVNFNGWFAEFPQTTLEIFNKYTEQDFSDAKNMGVDVIRLPIDFILFTSGTPDYIIDPLLFKLLDKAVDLAEKDKLYFILDCHFERQPEIDKSIKDFLLPVWSQIAEHFKNRSEYVIYEIFNEPQGISSNDWGEVQGEVINKIREIDQKHWIVVGGTDYNSIDALYSLPVYSDNKLLYTFHFYDPYIFTHQGVTGLDNLAGVPFPHKMNRMPAIPDDLKGTWAEGYLRYNYIIKGTRLDLAKSLKKASDFGKQRNVPVFCGEFGVLLKSSLHEDRISWHKTVRELFDENNIPWIKWAYYDCFGIFHSQLNGAFKWLSIGDVDYDLDVELIQALGLNPPPQGQREPLKSGFTVFDDDFGRGVRIFYNEQNTVNMYCTPAAEGQYAIHLGDLRRTEDRWDSLTLLMSVVDMTDLVRNGYVLEFKAITGKPYPVSVSFYSLKDKTNWQIGYTFDINQIPPDGNWHTVRVPLADFQVMGGVDINTDKYVESRDGSASWEKVNILKFYTMQETGSTNDLYLDSIKITK